ncbi:MAG: hypothetical protein ABGY96_07725 [bacterium]|nr:hypothetical protein [Gammaproteobacteria bacterium]
MKKSHLFVLISCFAFISTPFLASADHHEGKPAFGASRSLTIHAVVEAINHETRVVTLKGEEGNSVTFVASDAMRNIDQVVVGDGVLANFVEEVTVSVHAPGTVDVESAHVVALAKAKEGASPAGGILDTTVMTAVVEEINLESNTFKLKSPDGTIEEFEAQNPDNLRRTSVGDIVVITVTQALGIMIETPKE